MVAIHVGRKGFVVVFEGEDDIRDMRLAVR